MSKKGKKEEKKIEGSFFRPFKVCTVIKPKARWIFQILQIGKNKYIIILPREGDLEIYSIKLFRYEFSIPSNIHTDAIRGIT